VLLEVKDEGVGIPESAKAVVTQKFYRYGNEETRSKKGTGLGLYIVKELVNLHRGSMQILDNTPRGTIFKVFLPA
ncbi:MAG: ATP-binding protein, partial [Flavobacteriales bacterium]|nr:ATP-binding protein [Flavobacteriales bacterium]